MRLVVEGSKDVMAKLALLAGLIGKDEIQDIPLQAAKIIQHEAIARAPRGPTGNLEKSIIAKKGSKAQKGNAVAFCAVDRKIAPHAHMVEFGTLARRPKTKKVMADKEAGIIYGTLADPMPAKPFLRPAVDHKASDAKTYMKAAILDAIEKASKNG